MAGRIDGHLVELPQRLAAQRIDLGDPVDLVAEELDAQRPRLLVGGEDLDDVAAHAEGAAVEVVVVALVLDVDQLAQQLVAVDARPALEKHQHVEVRLRRAEAVDARDAGDDQHVARSSSALVAEWRILSISSLMEESFSM